MEQVAEVAQRAYVRGVVEAWITDVEVSKRIGTTSAYAPLSDCLINKMEVGQVFAIVRKWMQDNPGKWHFDMPSLIHGALQETCGKSQ